MDSQYWDSKYSVDEYVYTTEANRFVKEHLDHLHPGKMIDLAGGEGRNTVFFAERGWQVENIDFSEVALKKCRELAEQRGVLDKVTTTLADATEFHSMLAPVDLGVIAYLQIPMPELEKAIVKLIDSIRSGGVFFGVWHARENLTEGFGGPQDPNVLPTTTWLAEVLEPLEVYIEVLRNRDGQVQTKDGLKPSITLTALAIKH